jgi:hypothetical protein
MDLHPPGGGSAVRAVPHRRRLPHELVAQGVRGARRQRADPFLGGLLRMGTGATRPEAAVALKPKIASSVHEVTASSWSLISGSLATSKRRAAFPPRQPAPPAPPTPASETLLPLGTIRSTEQFADDYWRKEQPQIPGEIVQRNLLAIAARRGLGPDDLLFTAPTQPTRPSLRALPDPALLGVAAPNRAGRRYRHGTLTGYSMGGCRCFHCRGAYAHYRATRRAAGKDQPAPGGRWTPTGTSRVTGSASGSGTPPSRPPASTAGSG